MSRVLSILAALLLAAPVARGDASEWWLSAAYTSASSASVTGLVARWTFATDAPDSSGNGYHATLTNGAQVTGGSLWLDGTNDYAFVGDADALTPTNGITISCWYNIRTLPGNGVFYQLVAKEGSATDRSYYLGISDTSGTKFLIMLTSTNGSAFTDARYNISTTTGAWHHVAFTGCTTNYSMMHDGVVIGLTAGTDPYFSCRLFNNSGPLQIGARRTTPIDFFPGRIGDVRIYNYPMSTNAAGEIINEGTPP